MTRSVVKRKCKQRTRTRHAVGKGGTHIEQSKEALGQLWRRVAVLKKVVGVGLPEKEKFE